MNRFQKQRYLFSALRSYLFRKQRVVIEEIPSGKIIDIGGGGEGIIAQIGGENITVIDKRESEIKQAQVKAPKVTWRVADARNLPFESSSFDNATAFFSLMYMQPSVKEEVISEVFRVLPPGGEFWIWDAIVPKKGIFVIMLSIQLPNGKTIKTGYGSNDCIQTQESTTEILQKIGFDVREKHSNKAWFFLRAKKK